MKYTAYLNDTKFFDTSVQYDGYMLTEATVELEAGARGSFTFKVPPQNICYGAFNKLIDSVTVYRDDTEIFYGRVYGVSGPLNTIHTITCEGALAVFNDSLFVAETYESSLAELVAAIVENHNSQCPTWAVTVGTLEFEDDYVYRAYENYETSKTRLDDLVDSYGGYLEIRHENDVLYLDWRDYDNSAEEGPEINFGENLINITQESTADGIFTALIPLGATMTEDTTTTDDDGNETTESTEYVVDITSVNDGVAYIYDEDAVAAFGWVWKTETWDDVEDPANLLTKAKAELAEGCKSRVTIDLEAVDLANADESLEHFAIGKSSHVTAAPQGIDDGFVCKKLTINCLDPSKGTMQLGDTVDGFVTTSSKNYQANVKLIESVTANYATNAALSALSEKVKTNTSTITQLSDLIGLYVSEDTTVGSTVIEALEASIELTADEILATVSETYATIETNYITTWSNSDFEEDDAEYTAAAYSDGLLTLYKYSVAASNSNSFTLESGDYYFAFSAYGGSSEITVAFNGTETAVSLTETSTAYVIEYTDVPAGTYTVTITNSGYKNGIAYITNTCFYELSDASSYALLQLLSDSITAEVTRATEAEGELSTLVRVSADIGVEVARLVDGEYTSTKTIIDDTGLTVESSDESTLYLEALKTGINLYSGGVLGQAITSSGTTIYSGGSAVLKSNASGLTLYSDGDAITEVEKNALKMHFDDDIDLSITNGEYGASISSDAGIGLFANGGQICVYTYGDDGSVTITTTESGDINVDCTEGDIWLVSRSGNVSATPPGGGDSVNPVVTCDSSGSSFIDSGSGTITCSAGAVSSGAISFNCTFKSAPSVFVEISTSRPDLRNHGVSNRTTTGFDVYIYNSGSSSVDLGFRWIAIGQVAS